MRLHMAKLCEDVRFNERKRPVLDGLFIYILVSEFPCDHPPAWCCIEVDLERELGERETRLGVRLKNPEGDVIQTISLPPQSHGRGPFGHSVRVFAAGVMPAFRLEGPGIYTIEVLRDENVVGSDILAVMALDESGNLIG